MKKLMISGLGLIMVMLIAMPAVAENGRGRRGDGYKGNKSSHAYQHKNYDRRAYKKEMNREWREYQRERKQNIRAMKRADSPRERKRIKRNMVTDWRDYKHDVGKIKRHYHKQNRYYHKHKRHYQKHSGHYHKPAHRQYKKGHVHYRHHDRYPSRGHNYLAFGWWF